MDSIKQFVTDRIVTLLQRAGAHSGLRRAALIITLLGIAVGNLNRPSPTGPTPGVIWTNPAEAKPEHVPGPDAGGAGVGAGGRNWGGYCSDGTNTGIGPGSGGHTLADHVPGGANAQRRLNAWRGGRMTDPLFGLFLNAQQAQWAVNMAIRYGRARPNGPYLELTLKVPSTYDVGQVYERGGRMVRATTVVVIVSPLTCTILTAYPAP
jgi:hypothetical protein